MKRIMFLYLTFLFVIPLILGSNCETTPIAPASDYIIFGDFHGEVAIPIYSHIYKVANSQIFMDTTHKYPSSSAFYDGAWIKLPLTMMDYINDSIYSIPAELFENKTGRVGEPDSHDQGGIYLEVSSNSGRQHYLWLIDTELNDVPAFLHGYLRNLESVIDSLNKNVE